MEWTFFWTVYVQIMIFWIFMVPVAALSISFFVYQVFSKDPKEKSTPIMRSQMQKGK